MAISTYSLFYYGISIPSEKRFINWKEGVGTELTTELTVKGYTLTEIALAFETALNDLGALSYSVSVNRQNRVITVAASGAFTILAGTGSNAGNDAWSIIGFPAADATGTSLQATNPTGSAYEPQLQLQDYIPKEYNRRALSAAVSKSASGKQVTVQSFGEETFYKFNIKYITNYRQPPGFRIKDDPEGVENAVAFLDSITDKVRFEFMPDIDDKDTFDTLLLESIGTFRDGTGFELDEYYDKGLPGFFDSGLMVMKVIEE